VTALIIPANIEVTLVSASANKIPGITLSKSETTKRCAQILLFLGSFTLVIFEIKTSVIAPRKQRPNATPIGVRNSKPFFINRNDIPQVIPRKI
jgi:hypothetical protein